jgi:hypothetical protein
MLPNGPAYLQMFLPDVLHHGDHFLAINPGVNIHLHGYADYFQAFDDMILVIKPTAFVCNDKQRGDYGN